MDLTEGGIRVPWIAHWPAVIQPGGTSAQHCLTMDWSATLLDAGGAVPDAAYPLDGQSLLPVLRDAAHQFDRPMHWRMNHRGQRALRQGDWKYLQVDGHDYLFNIRPTSASAPTWPAATPSAWPGCAATGWPGTPACRPSPTTPRSAWAMARPTCRSAEAPSTAAAPVTNPPARRTSVQHASSARQFSTPQKQAATPRLGDRIQTTCGRFHQPSQRLAAISKAGTRHACIQTPGWSGVEQNTCRSLS